MGGAISLLCSLRLPKQFIQPIAKQAGTEGAKVGGQLMTAGPQPRDVDPGIRQFAGVADQPLFNAAAFDFSVELHSQNVVAEGERLVLVMSGTGQPVGAGRQVESIAMPVQYVVPSKMRNARRMSLRSELNLSPADLLACTRIGARTEG